MKTRIFFQAALVLIVVWLAGSCETDMQKAQDAYKPTDVVPIMLGVTGPTAVYQTEVRTFRPSYSRAGSSWAWTVTGATSTLSSDTRTLTVDFASKPANDTVYINVTETTSAGVTSPSRIFKVKVNPFCSFDINNFIGAFDCDEEGYGVYTANLTKHPSLANTIRNDNFWDWAAPGQYLNYTLSGDFLETVTVPKQTFTYGDGVVGWVEGSGKYDGCAHTFVVDYINEYDGDEYETHHEFSPGSKGDVPTIKKRNASTIK